MPGRPVTDQQARLYMQDRNRHTQRAAARAGFSERTGRRIETDPRLPSQRRPKRGRTVPDPLEAVWEPVLLPILENDPAVQAVTLLRHPQMTDPDAFPDDRVRRTLDRRVRDWRALHGEARDVVFRQTPEPGRMALPDLTDATGLGVGIASAPFAHPLYHFVPAHGGWQHAGVVLGGESFTALAETLQNAHWTSGGVSPSIAPTASRPHIATSTARPQRTSPGATKASARTTAWPPAATTPVRRMRTARWTPTTATSRPPSTRR